MINLKSRVLPLELMAKVLLIEDDRDLSTILSDLLEEEGYSVEVAYDGASALDLLQTAEYDVLIVDWNLPKTSGVILLKEIRHRGNLTPVLLLTARGDVKDKTEGLDSGADDYLTKPFQSEELTARLRALLRRQSQQATNILSIGPFTMDNQKFKVMKGDREIRLQPKEFALLEFFMRHPEEVFSLEALLNRVWPTDSEASTDTLRVYIGTLRSKIDDKDKPSFITTLHRVGYKFVVP
jgi:two-component system, OmpR family, copper resistance phosphate regulon response regulator CusR